MNGATCSTLKNVSGLCSASQKCAATNQIRAHEQNQSRTFPVDTMRLLTKHICYLMRWKQARQQAAHLSTCSNSNNLQARELEHAALAV